MYCDKCGQELQDGAQSCPHCGHVFKIETPSWYQKHSGCLLSVVLVLFIVGLLAAIAIPNYLRSKMKERQAEGKVYLKEIYADQIAYYYKNRHFGNTFKGIGFAFGRKPKYYTFYMSDREFSPDEKRTEVPVGTTTAFVNETSFRAIAVGNIDWDDTLDIWYIYADKDMVDHPVNVFEADKNLVHVVDDIAE